MNWVKLYIACLLSSLVLFAYFIFKWGHLMNKTCRYLRDNYNDFFKKNNLYVVESLYDIFSAKSAPMTEFFKENKFLYSKAILLDDNLAAMQKSMKKSRNYMLLFISLFILLGFSGKFIISWAGS